MLEQKVWKGSAQNALVRLTPRVVQYRRLVACLVGQLPTLAEVQRRRQAKVECMDRWRNLA